MATTEKVIGIKELYRPADGDAEVDIVAVHGLGGDGLRAWTCKENNICWLSHRDFLPKFTPNARILVWGYNSSFSSGSGSTPSKDRIHDHAHTLVAQLYADRKLEKRVSRPIIFLCHSLGGIVVKRALSYATTRSSSKISHIQSIATCTYGILFFGTPHHGTSKARLFGTLQKLAKISRPGLDVNGSLISALEEESETLQNITDYFVPLMKNYCIYFFWEQEKSDLKYCKDYIVDESSAAPMYDDTERAGISADHSNMVKFASNTLSAFRVVAAALDKYCEEAPEIIRRKCYAAEKALNEERGEEAADRMARIQGFRLANPSRSGEDGAPSAHSLRRDWSVGSIETVLGEEYTPEADNGRRTLPESATIRSLRSA